MYLQYTYVFVFVCVFRMQEFQNCQPEPPLYSTVINPYSS